MKPAAPGSVPLALIEALRRVGAEAVRSGDARQIEQLLRANDVELKALAAESGFAEWDVGKLAAAVRETVRLQSAEPAADPLAETLTARFAAALTQAKPAASSRGASPTARFPFLPRQRPGAARGSHTQDTAAYLTEAQLARGLFEGLVEPLPAEPVRRALTRRDSMTATQGAVFAGRLKEVNCAVFTGPCLDLAAQLAQTRNFAVTRLLEEAMGSPPVKVPFGPFDAAPFQRNALEEGPYVNRPCRRAKEFIASNAEALQTAGVVNRIPIGDYGERLSMALMQAIRIALSQVGSVAAPMMTAPVYQAVAGSLTFQPDPRKLLDEGIVSLGHALSLLLSREVPGKTAVQVLRDVADRGLVGMLGAVAPFAVIGPMASTGQLPMDPVGYDERGRAQLPRDLHQALVELRRQRETFSGEATSDYAARHSQGLNRTETLRGCPVASLGPIFGADGNLTLTAASPLNALAREYIGIVVRLLEEGGDEPLTVKPLLR
jgi:hypothetical protein